MKRVRLPEDDEDPIRIPPEAAGKTVETQAQKSVTCREEVGVLAAKRGKKRKPAWVAYYCKIRGFEVHGNSKDATLRVQLELLEPVPKVKSLSLLVYGEEQEWRIKEEWIPEEGWERKLVPSTPERGSYAARRSDGAAEVVTWWEPWGMTAFLNVLLADRQVYISFDAQEFHRNYADVRGIEWFTEGAWRSNVVGEDSDLY